MTDTVDKRGAIHCQGNHGSVGAFNANHSFAFSRFHESILRLKPLKIIYQRYRPKAVISPVLHYVCLLGWNGRDTAMTGSSGNDRNIGLDLATAPLHLSFDEKYSSLENTSFDLQF
ncbi:MAG: hypothetical protein V3S92_01515 [Alphaproteobacteria bacterium]